MFESYQVCPYTGLRSFTEEESLYFKGREDDLDQATTQLQRNKFLMLTGASGDGKSSLIYAGIIANARAGFLKSKYSQWCVADFRPERSPFLNLCKAIAKQLGIANTSTVQAELNHGFSALVDLYRNSKRFIDANSSAWQLADDAGKAAMKREAANLIILIDQFEEFFTNPENYHNGAPSRDSNLVLNILLETARIALDEDLPIYVVFTMRSDFIGQCAAFRGLPEYIGFSQFFVPRLNRSQLQQVIEEPAMLSGNRITRRLTERLIIDLTEGVDQLPILQHALNQIWVAADQGKEEMDLVHYAMVGGMPANELPDGQVSRFNQWFEKLSPEIKACYHAPNLQNVLDTHTNKLYVQAARYYADKTGSSISEEDAKLIIRTSFTCLTKIDQSRAVRNRMTLEEICNILGRPSIDTKTAGAVLNIFREPGNTFIRPFILNEYPETQNLEAGQVLDITHESLIRNWQYLGQWAKEEFDNLSISLDFEQQLGRWVNSGKSNTFLLSIGPLTYFENWYNKVKPNASWIARYLPEGTDRTSKLRNANELLKNAKEFLNRSAKKHAVTRTLIRYGAKRIAAVIGILAILVFSSFAIRNYYKKQNDAVLESLHQKTLSLAGNSKVIMADKARLVCEEIKMGQATLEEVINAVTDPVQKINLTNGIASMLIYQGWDQPKVEIFKSLSLADSLLENFAVPERDAALLSRVLKEMNDHRTNLELGYYYNPDPQIGNWRKRNALRSARWVKVILEKQPANFNDIQNLNLALENAINNKALTHEEIRSLTGTLSPFENALRTEWLQSNFRRDNYMIRGDLEYGFNFNGLYQELAYLYAASGNSSKVLQCLDTLMIYNQNYFLGDYATGGDNATNIASVYFRNGKLDSLNNFVSGYCSRTKISEEEFYARLLGRTLPSEATTSSLDLYPFMGSNKNINLLFSSRKQLSFFFNKYREVVQSQLKDAAEKDFLTAVSYKNEGILKNLNREQAIQGEPTVNENFERALSFYRKVNPEFLNQSIRIIGASGDEEIAAKRKTLFIYPDLRTGFHPMERRSFFFFYYADVFLDYIISNKLFDFFYPGPDELALISAWLKDFNTKNFAPSSFFFKKPRYEILEKLDQELSRRKEDQAQDFNVLYLYLGLYALQSGKTQEMVRYYNKIQPKNFFNILRSKEFGPHVNDNSFRQIAWAIKGLTKTGHFEKARQFIAIFKNPMNRSTLYTFVANELIRENPGDSVAPQLIDSARMEMGRVENIGEDQPNREVLAHTLVMQSPSKNSEEAYRLIKNIPEKFNAMSNICRSYAFHGELYNAQARIPEFISDSDLAFFISCTLYGYADGNLESKKEWENFNRNYPGRFVKYITYIDENS